MECACSAIGAFYVAPSRVGISPIASTTRTHRAMWASGDYPSMVETFLLPLGPRLVEAAGIAPGMRLERSPKLACVRNPQSG